MSALPGRTRKSLQSIAAQVDGNAIGTQQELAELDNAAGLVFGISVTLSSGTGTLDCDIEDSMDGVTWAVLDTFTQLTTTGGESIVPSRPPSRFVRSNVTGAGGGAGTWVVDVEMLGAFSVGAVQQ